MSAPRGQMRTGDRVTGVFLSPSRVVAGDIWNRISHVRVVPLVWLGDPRRDAAFDHSCGSGYFVWGIAGRGGQGSRGAEDGRAGCSGRVPVGSRSWPCARRCGGRRFISGVAAGPGAPSRAPTASARTQGPPRGEVEAGPSARSRGRPRTARPGTSVCPQVPGSAGDHRVSRKDCYLYAGKARCARPGERPNRTGRVRPPYPLPRSWGGGRGAGAVRPHGAAGHRRQCGRPPDAARVRGRRGSGGGSARHGVRARGRGQERGRGWCRAAVRRA
ncbi:hypothetical protein SCYAM73S_00330 [Streptomyces cyaneofuscatus]